MKRLESKIAGVLILSMFFGIFAGFNHRVNAAFWSRAAKMAYAKILSSQSAAEGIIQTSWGLGSDTKFALLDINKDGIPELLFTPDDGYHLDVVSYVNGKAKAVGGGFSGSEKYYPNRKIYYSDNYHDAIYQTYYRFNGKKMVELARAEGRVGNHPEISTYYIGKKRVSKKKYKGYIKKILKGAKRAIPKFHKNTVGNRKKYLVGMGGGQKVYDADANLKVTFTGKIVKHRFTHPGNGTKLVRYDLVFKKRKFMKSEMWGKKTGEKRIMINPAYLSMKISKYVGKNVKVSGDFITAASSYYCERYAIMASKIKIKQ